MEISDFRTIVALVESGSVTAAAKMLNRVPSAITTRLQNIESQLNTSLFVKSNRRFMPTAEGRTLYGNALQIIRLVSSAEQQATHPAPGGRFKVGALDSMAATRLPQPLASLYQCYRDISIELTTGISKKLFDGVLNLDLDAAFIADAPLDDRVVRVPVFKEELVIITVAGHPDVSSPAELGHSTLLVFRDGCSYRDRLTAWFAQYRCRPYRLAEMTSYHAILGGVSAGMGVGVVPRPLLLTFPSPALIKTHPFEALNSQIVTELVWRKDNLTANTRALMDILSEMGKEV